MSFDEQGKEKFIEVKTTNASAMTPFYVSPREPAVADQKGARYKLYRVFDFGGNPRVFALEGPLSNRLHLVACAWIAIPKTSSSRSGSVQMGNRRLSSGIYLLRAVRRHMNNSLSAVVYDIVRLGWRLTTTITAYVVVHTGVAKICSATYPTEEPCLDHGGTWDTENQEHYHECTACDEHDAECVSCYDWVHNQPDCRQPRRWSCPQHRQKDTAVSGKGTPTDVSMSDEKQPFWWAEQVNSLVQQSKIGRALKVLNRLLDLNVDRQYVLLYKVRLLQKLGRLKEGLAWVCLEAELNPKDPKVLALRDELMEFYPYSLFDSRRPTPDLLAAFQSVDSDWPDVAGISEIKIQIHSDIILPIRDPERFRRLKVGLPNGVLFYGPPGCGKTFLARKIAEKIKYAFREIRMSDVGSPFTSTKRDQTAKNVRGG